MAQTYPTDPEQRKNFWIGQLKGAQAHMDPFMKAGAEIVKMYNNMPAGTRQRILSSLKRDRKDNDERVKASLVFAWADQSVASMVGDGEIDVAVKGKNKLSTGGAPVVAANVNYWYDETDQVEEDEAIALEAHLMPYSVLKLGWTAELDIDDDLFLLDTAELLFDDPEEENGFLAIGTQTRVERDQDHDAHIDFNSAVLDDETVPQEIKDAIVKPHIERHRQFKNNIQPAPHAMVRWQSPFARHWPSDDFLMDAAALTGQKDARWIAFRIRQPVYRWKADENMSGLDDLKPNSELSDEETRKNEDDQRRRETEFDDYGIAEGWEIWARDFPVSATERQNLLVTVIETHPGVPRHDEWPEEYNALDDYPVEVVRFQDNLKTWINMPSLRLAGADNVQVLVSEFLDSMLYTMRKQKNLYLVDAEIYDTNKLQNMMDLPDSSVVRVENLAALGGNPAVQVWPMNQISQDKLQTLNIIRSTFDQAIGVAEPSRRAGSDTATEAAIVERRTSDREDRRMLRFRRMQRNRARKWWQLQTQFRPDMADLIDPRTRRTMEVTDDIARGEYRFSMEIRPRKTSSAVEQNNAIRRFNQMAGTIPLLAQMGVTYNIVAETENVLRAFGEKDIAKFLPQAPDEFEAAMAEIMGDPARRQQFLQMLGQMSVGGNGFGAGPGPLIPQNQTANPSTEARQTAEAERLEG